MRGVGIVRLDGGDDERCLIFVHHGAVATVLERRSLVVFVGDEDVDSRRAGAAREP